MKTENYTFNVYENIPKEDRKKWKLYIDAVYCSNPKDKTIKNEVVSKLMLVKNQGGFRFRGSIDRPKFVVLFTSGEDIYWKDEFDTNSGILLYYGDNKRPGTDLHKTNIHGNEILRNVFEMACSDEISERYKIPPIFVFKKHRGSDVKFLGLAVPGVNGKTKKDWLTAVWGCNDKGDRFQNYQALFTILNTETGSENEDGFGINLAWIDDILNDNAFKSIYAPREWKKYIMNKKYKPLIANSEKKIKSREEQLPSDEIKIKMLEELQSYFIDKDRGYSFETFAADLIKYMDKDISRLEVTQPYKDGGIDGVGKYKIFEKSDNSIYVDFYLQAKCYSANNPVTVKDTSRLISRIKNRQFGVMMTTSYIATQAYEEIINDNQPIVLINGKNIIEYIFYEMEIKNVNQLKKWLEENY